MEKQILFWITLLFFSYIPCSYSVDQTAIYYKLTPTQRKQLDTCNILQLLQSGQNEYWIQSEALVSLRHLIAPFKNFTKEKLLTGEFCDIVKVWSRATDAAFRPRFCNKGSDVWCTQTLPVVVRTDLPFCSAYWCGKNPNAKCKNSANWLSTCQADKKCVVSCLRIVGTGTSTHADLAAFEVALSRTKRGDLNEGRVSSYNNKGKRTKLSDWFPRQKKVEMGEEQQQQQQYKSIRQKRQLTSTFGYAYCGRDAPSCDNCGVGRNINGTPCNDNLDGQNSCCMCLILY